MAFSDELIRAMVRVGQFSDTAAEAHLVSVLIKRRDKIGRAFLPAINPVVDVSLTADGVLTFKNAAVDARFATPPSGGYRIVWSLFDNATGESKPLGSPVTAPTTTANAPSGLPTAAGSFVRVSVSAVDPPNPSWTVPVEAYFKRSADGWTLVGLERPIRAETR